MSLALHFLGIYSISARVACRVACVLHVKSAQLMDHRDNHYQCMQISSRNGTKSSSSKIDVSCELSKNGK